MLNKISSILSILSFLISLTTIGAGWTAYKWVTSPQFEAMMMEKVMEGVGKILPNQIDKKLEISTKDLIILKTFSVSLVIFNDLRVVSIVGYIKSIDKVSLKST